MTVAEVQQLCLEQNAPFYSYRLPGEEELWFGAQLDGEVERFDCLVDAQNRDGFVAVPFDASPTVSPLFIRGDIRFKDVLEEQEMIQKLREVKGLDRDKRVEGRCVGREEYQAQLNQLISALQNDEAKKVVLSRGLAVKVDGYANAVNWFEKLLVKYPDAFVFLVSVPGVTTWMGATPEVFMEKEAGGMKIMSLAGTRAVGIQEEWGDKEIEEQAIVTDYISSIVDGLGELSVEGPFTKKAGNIEHLCTTFEFLEQLSIEQVEHLRHELHPAPAVSGFPVEKAISMIKQIEGEDRRYYAGYIGPIHKDGTFQWFVNLRCMEIFSKHVHLYVGGGITALSNPALEWEETELKSRTLLDVIL